MSVTDSPPKSIRARLQERGGYAAEPVRFTRALSDIAGQGLASITSARASSTVDPQWVGTQDVAGLAMASSA